MTVNALSSPAGRQRTTLAFRTVIAALLLVFEKFLLNFLVDFDAAQHATGLGADVRIAQHLGFRFIVTFAVAMVIFGYVRGNERLRAINVATREAPWRPGWLASHVLFLVPLALLSYSFYGGRGLQLPIGTLAALWMLVATGAAISLFAALAPWRVWREILAALGVVIAYAAAAGAMAASLMTWSQMLWAPTTQVTFEAVEHLLRPMIPALQANPATQVLDTGRFAVQISYLCSGLEGAGLMLAFCSAWLMYFRKEYYFPRALAIIPVGLCLLFLLNILRITALVMIGHAGFPQIAIYGFHSQAGWIAFNGTAAGIAYASRYSSWLNRTAETRLPHGVGNPSATYLLPLLAILAAGMLSHAASSGFETFYGLRLFAAIAVLWYCAPKLRALDLRVTWRAAAVGVAVFALWMAAAHMFLRPALMPSSLTRMSEAERTVWILTRIVTSITVVPVAEELAYRGYLMRRLQAVDFESIRFADTRLWALLISSILFGLGHGPLWLPGIAAGIAYGFLLMRTGRMGEAIAAHAFTNGLIATCVLAGGQWQLW